MDASKDKVTFVRFVNKLKIDICLFLYILYYVGRICFRFIVELSQFKSIFASMNVHLPVVTSFFLSISDILRNWWMVGLVPALLLFLAIVGGILFLMATKGMDDSSAVGPLIFFGLLVTVIFLYALDALISFTVYMPMLKLVNSVG